jgi:pyruvate kinase
MTTVMNPQAHSPNVPITEDLSHINRTKIIATLGPATDSPERIRQLIEVGVSVFRLNLSHGAIEDHLARADRIRQVTAEMKHPVAILADLQGPKLRTGYLQNDQPIPLEVDSVLELTTRTRESSPGLISTTSQELVDALEPGAPVLIDDGKIHLEVLERVNQNTLKCRVTQGGTLQARKGINVPGTMLPITAMTDKDKADVQRVVEQGHIDYLALSFVQRAQDIVELKTYVKNLGLECPPVIAKIEKPQAMRDIDNILREADGLMVARGDLGVELKPEEVPIAQKRLVDKANWAEKPVIIATQMLESMIDSLQPSRSDVSDIANAVFDGADVLMLSGETSVGEHPVETVAMMGRIIHEAERNIFTHQIDRPAEESRLVSPNFYHAIAHTASYASRKANVKALVVFSNSGSMAQRVSKLKPARPIIALTPKPDVCNRMSMLWGVIPLLIEEPHRTDELLESGEQAIIARNLLHRGDSVVFCAGNTQLKGATNMLKIYHLGEDD